jgi:hypothetical protein
VLVQTTADGSALARAQTQVSEVGANSIASSNIASALATNCTGCNSTAVAVQVVFVTGSPQYFQPGNAATAVNSGCTGCGSFAYAWQYVVQTDGPVMLTPDGRQQVQALRHEIDATAASIPPDSLEHVLLLRDELRALIAQLKDVVDSQVRLAGVHATGAADEHVDESPAVDTA